MIEALRSRLWIRLVGVFLLASVVPLLTAGWFVSGWLESRTEAEAAKRLRAQAQLAASLIEGFVERGRGKLVTVGRLLGDRTADIEVKTPANRAFRDTVLSNINSLVEPQDLYLDIHFYNGMGDNFVAQVATEEVQTAQNLVTNLDEVQVRYGNENVSSPIVRRPLFTGETVVAEVANDHFGFPSVKVSAPVASAGVNDGALVAYVDLRVLRDLMEPLVSDANVVELIDSLGGTMLRIGDPIDGATLTETVTLSDYSWGVCTSASRADVFSAVREVRRQTWAWTTAATSLAVVLSLLCSAWLVRPVRTLTRAARAMATGDLSVRAGLNRSDEIGRLGAAFDSMAASLEQLDAAKSNFVATVSHELRTPLTSIRLTLGNLLDGVVGDLERKPRAAIDRVRHDVERLDRIVRDTLALARLEAGAERLDASRCDLRDIAESAVELVRPMATEADVRVEISGSASAVVDRDLIGRVFVNLLDNAIKFAPAGSEVRIELDGCGFRILDKGPGFGVENPFDAFVQGESDGVKNAGVGLGLAIVRQLVELHGGSVQVVAGAGGIVAVELRRA